MILLLFFLICMGQANSSFAQNDDVKMPATNFITAVKVETEGELKKWHILMGERVQKLIRTILFSIKDSM